MGRRDLRRTKRLIAYVLDNACAAADPAAKPAGQICCLFDLSGEPWGLGMGWAGGLAGARQGALGAGGLASRRAGGGGGWEAGRLPIGGWEAAPRRLGGWQGWGTVVGGRRVAGRSWRRLRGAALPRLRLHALAPVPLPPRRPSARAARLPPGPGRPAPCHLTGPPTYLPPLTWVVCRHLPPPPARRPAPAQPGRQGPAGHLRAAAAALPGAPQQARV